MSALFSSEVSGRFRSACKTAGIVLVAVFFSGCAAVTTLKNPNVSVPPASASVLLMKPDVQLAELTAGGLEEPNAQWTSQGFENVRAALKNRLSASNVSLVDYREPTGDPQRAQSHIQLLKLHEVVGATVLQHKYNQAAQLPTKTNVFDYTLGRDTSSLAEEFGADYALFTYLHDSYASGGRVAMIVALAVVGVGVQGGVQRGFASLVDLRSGDIAWFNVLVSNTGDLRTPEPAAAAVESLLKELPL